MAAGDGNPCLRHGHGPRGHRRIRERLRGGRDGLRARRGQHRRVGRADPRSRLNRDAHLQSCARGGTVAYQQPREHGPHESGVLHSLVLPRQSLLPDDRGRGLGRRSSLVPVATPGLPPARGPRRRAASVPRAGHSERDPGGHDRALPGTRRRRRGCARGTQRGSTRDRGGACEPRVGAQPYPYPGGGRVAGEHLTVR